MDSDMKRSFVIEPYNMGKCSTEAIQKKRRRRFFLSWAFIFISGSFFWMQSLILEVSGKTIKKGNIAPYFKNHICMLLLLPSTSLIDHG